MNCFEARNGFVAFWRKTLDAQARAALLGHLEECAGCDRALRVFALTAPVLYSDAAPAARKTHPIAGARAVGDRAAGGRVAGELAWRGQSRTTVAHGRGRNRRGQNSWRGWRAACAMVAMIAAAGSAAYLATVTSRQTLDEALSNPEPAATATASDELLSMNDFAR